MEGGAAGRAVAINDQGDVLVAVATTCFPASDNPKACDFTAVRPQRAVLLLPQ